MKLLDYIFAARPLLHVPIWSVYLVALHYHHGLSGGSFGPVNLAVLASLSLVATSAYYFNQIYDYQTDLLNGKLGFLQRNLIARRTMILAALIVTAVALAVAPLISMMTFFILAQLFLMGVVYSFPPFRLKDRPLGGLLVNAYCFGTLVSLSVMPGVNIHNAALLGWDNPFYFFFAVGSIHIMTTLADRHGDAAAGKRTIGVVVPSHVAKLLALVFAGVSVHVAQRSAHWLLVGVALSAMLVILVSIAIPRQSVERFATKLPIVLLGLVAGYFYPGFIVFMVALIVLTRIYYRRRFGISYPKLT